MNGTRGEPARASHRSDEEQLFQREGPAYLSGMTTTVASLAERMRPVLARYGVQRGGIFGSYARGDATSESDLDLLVELPRGASLLDLVGLELELRDELGVKVDANTYRAIHPLLRERILGDEIRIL